MGSDNRAGTLTNDVLTKYNRCLNPLLEYKTNKSYFSRNQGLCSNLTIQFFSPVSFRIMPNSSSHGSEIPELWVK
jgi:hypothetical protein